MMEHSSLFTRWHKNEASVQIGIYVICILLSSLTGFKHTDAEAVPKVGHYEFTPLSALVTPIQSSSGYKLLHKKVVLISFIKKMLSTFVCLQNLK